uniref:Outer dense fiber protein 2 n=1 Tax=Lygus hesperus TaxID=30085 RepID=A0A0A9Y943_LYGHE
MEEVSSARVELDGAIKEAVDRHKRCEDAEQRAADLILRVKEAEFEKIKCSSSRDRIFEMENQLTIAKQKHSESLEDVEEAKRILKQQLEAVENMRQLYLETEQLAEEQSRKLEILEHENERLSQQITVSMDQAREQFQYQVFELGPLADSVAKLNEGIMVNKEKKSQADKQAEKLQLEIMQLTAKNDELKSKLSDLREHFSMMDFEKAALRETLDSKQEERSDAKKENYALRAKIKDLEEINGDKEMKIQFKETEVKDLSARLETLREECARQISSNKNSLQSARKANLRRLTLLEKDLAKTKADECGAEKERDEIQMRLEEQISSLSQNLCQAQEKIKTLQDSLGYINKDRNIKVRRISPHTRV